MISSLARALRLATIFACVTGRLALISIQAPRITGRCRCNSWEAVIYMASSAFIAPSNNKGKRSPKFGLAIGEALMVTLGLIWWSCHLLKMPWEKICHFALAVTIMTFTLTSLAIGLGVLYPNFKKDNSGKLVSSFGGSLNLPICWGRWFDGVEFALVGAGKHFLASQRWAD